MRDNREITVKLDNNNHSVFALFYHLILVVKYRRKVFDDPISEYAENIFVKIAPSYHITLLEWNHDQDHVHILFKAHPNSELSKFINAYKSASSRLIKKQFPEIRKKLWKEYFWSQSFCLVSTGTASVEIIRKYIEKQGEKNEPQGIPIQDLSKQGPGDPAP
ncbi:MAG: IS200/IS605 family transposase [Faecalicoccus sp.]|nr:IS200/IS605 family transposase [Faecalicoccus sp.]